jgi:hypothetical protein
LPTGTRGSFPQVKWQGHEADHHSPLHNAETMNEISYTSTLQCLHGMFFYQFVSLSLLFNDNVNINLRQYKINDKMINEYVTAGGMNW